MLIREARVTYVLHDYGKLCLTDRALFFGKDKIEIPLYSIEKIDTYPVWLGGGLLIIQKNGKEHKFSFNKKKDFEAFYDYLSNVDFSSVRPRDNEVCAFCGAKVEGRYCSVCGNIKTIIEPEENVSIVCWSCGETLKEGAKFCPDCGAKQDVNKLLVRIGGEIAKKYVTTVCPRCHSKNIKIYRKGYDYRPGFWGSLFGVRGAGYVGGFKANNACCHCMDCGKDWETDYDIRKL